MRMGLFGAAAALVLGAAAPASAALIHAYDCSNGVTDLVGTANGQLLGDASVAGGVLTLDGAGDYVQFGSKLVPGAGADFSVYFSVNIAETQNGITEFISQGASGGPGFYIGSDGGSGFRLSDANGAPNVALPSRGVFHNLLLTNGANGPGGNDGFKFYIDGNLAFSAARVANYTVAGTNTRLGAQFEPYGEYFKGQIDNLKIYDGVVSYATASAPLGVRAVPEPGTWALMLLGFGAAGASLRARRRLAA